MESASIPYTTSSGERLQKTFSVDSEIILLSGLGITAIDLSPLTSCTRLRELHITSNWLEYIDLSPLQHCTNLELLSLSLNRLLEVDLSPLSHCQEFMWLNLERNWLQSVDLSPLFLCPKFAVFEVDYDVELRADPALLQEEVIPEGLRGFLSRIKVQETRVPSAFLVLRVQQVMELFQLLPLEQLVELLRFTDIETFQAWRSSLPEHFPVVVEANEVQIHSDRLSEELRRAILDSTTIGPVSSTHQTEKSSSTDHPRLELGVGVGFKAQISEESLLQWVRDAMTSHEEGRWHHAAVEGWTVLESLLSVIYRSYFKESKPLHMSYAQMIEYLNPHFPKGQVDVSLLEQATKLRSRIYHGLEKATSSMAELIIEAALEFYSKLDVLMTQAEEPSKPIEKLVTQQVEPRVTRPIVGRVSAPPPRARQTGEQVLTTPCCGVQYSVDELVKWVRSKGSCPECRSPLIIRGDQVVKL
ncbi:MAG: hypothetical protein ACFFCO_08445 [Promethearchaeota archaeon]